MARRTEDFQTIRSEGGLLPPDLLRRLLDPREKVEGTQPADYALSEGERLNEVITQSWNRLRKHWAEFHAAVANLPEGEAGTGLTNDKWNLPLLRELGFGLIPTGAGPEIDGRIYAINRFFGPVPIHLIGCGLSLDRRAAGVRGAAVTNPHGLVQEYLNRSQGHLWAIVSNGFRLRVLRDNQALSRQAFIEFNFEAMFDGEVYSDFVLFWLVVHATRFAPRDSGHPETCWLERWVQLAEEQGTRALGDLRGGVERALQILGEGFTSHPKNTALREVLRAGQLSANDLHGQLLRVVYRLIFLFVAEDRTLDGQSLLHPPDDSAAARTARERYAAHYSTARLRDLAGRIKGSRHGDLWRQFHLLVQALSGNESTAAVRKYLALPALGSLLWNPDATAALNNAELTNHDLLEAIRHLAFTRQGRILRPVDYRNLGAEELGGVYESLLALTPQISADGARFTFAEFAGNVRKTSGSYYTPDSLVQCLLDSALDPVVADAIQGKTGVDAETAILSLKICDPAVGSGHFLVGAAHRLARHLARARARAEGESEPSPLIYQQALRDVIGRCLYGVDINPMATELCRVGLWLEAMVPGKPLSFLDHHIRVGNSLIGATPELIAGGLPDETFTPIEGDDKIACAVLKKLNKLERKGWGPLFAQEDTHIQTLLQQTAALLEELSDDQPADIHAKELAFRHYETTKEYRNKKLLADAWCAAFVIRKYFQEHGREASAICITQGHLNDFVDGRPLPADLAAEIEHLVSQYQFFHWHLAFPEVFSRGGFDCVLSNPPWERVKLQEKEWFAERSPEIANAPNAAVRKKLIDALKASDPAMYRLFLDDSRRADGESHLMRNSGRYPLCGRGDINLYAVFAENMKQLIDSQGRIGCIIPSEIATADTTKFFFQELMRDHTLISLYSFENEEFLFPNVHHATKFCLLTICGIGKSVSEADLIFYARQVGHLSDRTRRFSIDAERIRLLNPNTQTCPVFRSSRDAELTMALYRRISVLVKEGQSEYNPWGLVIRRVLNMGTPETVNMCINDPSGVDTGNLLPVFEAKLIHQYEHRFASYTNCEAEETTHGDKFNQTFTIRPRFWVPISEVERRIGALWKHHWLLCWRDITNTTNEHTVIACILPFVGTDFTLRIGFLTATSPILAALFLANINSLSFEYATRQSLGGTHLSDYIFRQLPGFAPDAYSQSTRWICRTQTLQCWLMPRILELTYTAWDLELFAQDCSWSGPPFRWEEQRRFLLRCELDAAFFHLYFPVEANGDWRPARKADGCPYDETPEQLAELKRHFPTPRDAVAYIMDTFPIVRRKDEEKYDGDYRTKRVILEIFDAMQEAIRTGKPYQTRLDPPPADPRVAHLAPGQRRPAGEAYELVDLLHVELTGETAPVRLPAEWRVPGDESAEIVRFKFPGATGKPLHVGDVVILRHPTLRQGDLAIALAVGEVRSIQDQLNPQTQERMVLVLLKTAGTQVKLELPAAEWDSFRPLAVKAD